MRARTRRFTSLFFGIVLSSFTAVRTAPQRPAAAAERSCDADPEVCPPLPRMDPGWGRVLRLGADRAPKRNVATARTRARGSALAHGHAARRRDHDAGPRGDRTLGLRAAQRLHAFVGDLRVRQIE